MQFESVNGVLSIPARVRTIPAQSQWLAGIGAGSWFYLEKEEAYYRVTRYSAIGIPECSGLFTSGDTKSLNLDLEYQFTYLSHCKEITILQNGVIIKLLRANTNQKETNFP